MTTKAGQLITDGAAACNHLDRTDQILEEDTHDKNSLRLRRGRQIHR